MAAANQVLPGVTIEALTTLRLAHPGRGPHTITGPIYVEEAEPGDTLKVHIERIVPRSYGANWNLPGELGLGQFPDRFPAGQVHYFYFDLKRSTTQFAPGITVPLRPFPGVIGVARAEPGRYSTVPPGPFGGNMDVREMIEGTTVYLPVFVEGALLWSGDSHAAQGNGEINLTAIETAFNELRLHIEVIKRKALAWPRIETPTHWLTVVYDRDLNKALEILKAETRAFLAETQELASEKVDEWMATRFDCRIAEVVNQVKGVFCAIPKRGRQAGPRHSPPEGNVTLFRDQRLVARSAGGDERSGFRHDRADRRTQGPVEAGCLFADQPDHGLTPRRHFRVEEVGALPRAEKSLELKSVHHRGTENTEEKQRKEMHIGNGTGVAAT